MEIDVAVDILRVIAVLIITVVWLVISIINRFYTCADNGKSEKRHDNSSARGE
jgi:hypothetical protein